MSTVYHNPPCQATATECAGRMMAALLGCSQKGGDAENLSFRNHTASGPPHPVGDTWGTGAGEQAASSSVQKESIAKITD
jgi:hypothetical protein